MVVHIAIHGPTCFRRVRAYKSESSSDITGGEIWMKRDQQIYVDSLLRFVFR